MIIQGFGGIGSYLAKYLSDRGARIVGVGDAYGALYREDGLDVDELLERRDSFGTVTRLYRDVLSNRQLLEQPCDILVLAASGATVTTELAAKIKASLIVEAVNVPTPQDAMEILTEREILVIPDVLSFAGDVIVSYFEWVQNNQGYYWSESEVQSRLDERVRQAFDRVYQVAERYGVNMRLAAYIVGVQRLAEASRWRGWI